MDNSVFPLPFTTHVIFVIIAVVFFLIQFIRLRYKYQLIMAVAVGATMLLYLKDTRMWVSSVGILELGLLIMALAAAIIEKKSRNASEKIDKAQENLEQ